MATADRTQHLVPSPFGLQATLPIQADPGVLTETTTTDRVGLVGSCPRCHTDDTLTMTKTTTRSVSRSVGLAGLAPESATDCWVTCSACGYSDTEPCED